ncbi:unnamed protein product [Ectocarpus sp. 8 AP-2014]
MKAISTKVDDKWMTEVETDFRGGPGTSMNATTTEASGHALIPAFLPSP